MKTKHTIEIEVEWDRANTPGRNHRAFYSNGDLLAISNAWLEARGITRPKQQPTPGVWHKINDPSIEMPSGRKEVLVRGGQFEVKLVAFEDRWSDRTEFMVVPE